MNNINPEFRRNLWLEINLNRLIIMPFILALLFAAIYLLITSEANDTVRYVQNELAYNKCLDEYSGKIDYKDKRECRKSTDTSITVTAHERAYLAMNYTAITIFMLLVAGWGSKLASESILSEVKMKTWDSQRMSILTPWSMVWSKLFGSTVYTWYGGFLCLIVYLITVGANHEIVEPVKVIFLILISSLLLISSSFLLSIFISGRSENLERSTGLVMVVVIFLLFSFASLMGELGSASGAIWYGIDFRFTDFLIGTVLFFTFWTFVGSIRAMKSELRQKTTCLGWVVFIITAFIYLEGFFESDYSIGFVVLNVVFMILIVLMLLFEKKNTASFRSFFKSCKEKNFLEVLEKTPLWLATSAVVLPVLVFNLISREDMWIPILLSLFMFILRDMALIIFLNLGKNPKRADVASVLWFTVYYAMLPSIVYSINNDLNFLFWPQDTMLSAISGFSQAVVMIYLLVYRWRSSHSVVSV